MSRLDVDRARRRSDDASPATASLISTYGERLESGPAPAPGGFLACGSQSAEVTRSQADGLRRHHGAAADTWWAFLDERQTLAAA